MIDLSHYCSFNVLKEAVTDQWLRTDFGYYQIDVPDAANIGWTDYMIKLRQKTFLLGAINCCHPYRIKIMSSQRTVSCPSEQLC